MYSPYQIQGDGRMKDLTSYVYSFEEMIQGNFLYVDKTEYIWQLIRPSRVWKISDHLHSESRFRR